MFNPGYVPQYSPYYYPQYYQPQPGMYQGPPPPGYNYNYPPPGYQNPYNQQNSKGFIMDKLSQNMNGVPNQS